MRFLAALRIHNGQAVLRPDGLKAFRLNIRSSSGGTYEVLPDKSLRAKVFACLLYTSIAAVVDSGLAQI